MTVSSSAASGCRRRTAKSAEASAARSSRTAREIGDHRLQPRHFRAGADQPGSRDQEQRSHHPARQLLRRTCAAQRLRAGAGRRVEPGNRQARFSAAALDRRRHHRLRDLRRRQDRAGDHPAAGTGWDPTLPARHDEVWWRGWRADLGGAMAERGQRCRPAQSAGGIQHRRRREREARLPPRRRSASSPNCCSPAKGWCGPTTKTGWR